MNVGRRSRWVVTQDDQRRRLFRTLGDSPERAHLQVFNFVWPENLATEAHFRCHLSGALSEYVRRHAIRRLVDEVAREVLRFTDDSTRAERALQGLRISLRTRLDDDGQRIDL